MGYCIEQVIGDLVRQIGGDANEEAVLGQMVRVWVDRMPLVTQHERRKLLALALCSLLGANSPPAVLQHFNRILSNVVETLNDITKITDMGCCMELVQLQLRRVDSCLNYVFLFR